MRPSTIALLFLIAAVTPAGAQQLPLGDGHVSDHPETGYVYACQSSFRVGGARHDGPWIQDARWDPAAKPHVSGRVMWPQASFVMSSSHGDALLMVEGNGLPVNQPTGTFPISPSDPVYRYDTNPNTIAGQHLDFSIPAAPERADRPSCLPMGMIGFTTTGVAIYNALDDAGRDAAAHEIQDLCDGHPQARGQYHYHSSSPCLPGAGSDSVVGWALDGYPILGMRDARGTLLTNARLDACHGRAESLTVDGRTYDYAYRLTREYPYMLGCYRGTVPSTTLRAIRRGLGPPRRGAGHP